MHFDGWSCISAPLTIDIAQIGLQLAYYVVVREGPAQGPYTVTCLGWDRTRTLSDSVA